MKTVAGVLGLFALVIVAGCEIERVVYLEEAPPTRPTGISSITADGAVYLYWDPNGEHDLDHYRVYRGFSATGRFDFIGATANESFVDYRVVNGETYYYAVSAVDYSGLESELSLENVYDTPRPEGYDLLLYDLAVYPEVSGFDLSLERRVRFDAPVTFDNDVRHRLRIGNASHAAG